MDRVADRIRGRIFGGWGGEKGGARGLPLLEVILCAFMPRLSGAGAFADQTRLNAFRETALRGKSQPFWSPARQRNGASIDRRALH
jgi:hypothetical protein